MIDLIFAQTTDTLFEGLGKAVGETAKEQVVNLFSNPTILVIGIALIVAAVVVIVFLKRILVNSALGLIAWLILFFFFKIELPIIPSLIASIVFGLGGIGVILILKFFGALV